MNDAIFVEGDVAVITGAALGIGRATALKCAGLGMGVVLADLGSDDLDDALLAVRAAAADPAAVVALPTDVADAGEVDALRDAAIERFGRVDFLMNNAVTRVGRGMWADLDEWRRAVDVNLWGVIHGVRAFAPGMIASDRRARIVNVGSKQGITNPPGHPVYNLCKAAIRSFTEGLAHDLRANPDAAVTAHLLIPGWTTTGRNARKPGAWRPDQVVDEMLAALARDDFYILCPDGETTRADDVKRILWSAGDITENRPALSRWHGGYDAAFDAFEP